MKNKPFKNSQVFIVAFCIYSISIANIHSQETLEKINDLAPPRILTSSCIFQDQIYLFGGTNNFIELYAIVDVYDPATNTSTSLNNMPEILWSTVAETVHDKIYLIGGYNGESNKPCDLVYEFSPESQSWVPKTNMPITSFHSSSCVIDNEIYVFSGAQSQNQNILAFKYNTTNDTWIALPNMLIEQQNSSAHVIGGKIYVIGGHKWDKEGIIHGKSEVFDPDSNKWTLLSEMPLKVTNAAGTVYDNKIIILGGNIHYDWQYPYVLPSNCIQEYDPNKDEWRVLNDMPFKRGDAAYGKIGDYLYLIGGYCDTIEWQKEDCGIGEVWKCDLNALTYSTSYRIVPNKKNPIKIYPNPSLDEINVESPNNCAIKQIQIISLDGKIAFDSKSISINNKSINIKNLHPGIYIIKANTGVIYSQKIIIK